MEAVSIWISLLFMWVMFAFVPWSANDDTPLDALSRWIWQLIAKRRT